MSMIFKFYTGDPKKIIEVILSNDFSKLGDPALVFASADFSFRIYIQGLDLLTEKTCELQNLAPFRLVESLKENLSKTHIGNDDWGLFSVSQEWISLFASLKEDKISDLARNWMTELIEQVEKESPLQRLFGKRIYNTLLRRKKTQKDEELDQTISVASKAIKDLIILCKTSIAKNLPVLFYFSL